MTLNDFLSTTLHIFLPIVIANVGWYVFLKKKEQQEWFENLRKPSWYTTNPVFASLITVGCLGLMGYGSRLVFNAGPGVDNRLATGLYGTTLVAYALISIPITVITKDIKKWAGAFGMMSTLVGLTGYAFYQINDTAGLMLIPLTIWWSYNAAAMLVMKDKNVKIN